MDQVLTKQIVDLWQREKADQDFPAADVFAGLIACDYAPNLVWLSMTEKGVVLRRAGENIQAALPEDMQDRPIKRLFGEALQPVQEALLRPCFDTGLGLFRQSRLWLGDRHCDIEALLMPVPGPNGAGCDLIGIVQASNRCALEASEGISNEIIERLTCQAYLTLGRSVTLEPFDSQTWAVLDAMGTSISVDGKELAPPQRLAQDAASRHVRRLNRTNVLIVGREDDLAAYSARLGTNHRLLSAASGREALAVLRNDSVDVLMSAETLPDMSGLSLINTARTLSQHTAGILVHEGAASMPAPKSTPDLVVDHLCKPVGEFTLMQAVNDAGERARTAFRSPVATLFS